MAKDIQRSVWWHIVINIKSQYQLYIIVHTGKIWLSFNMIPHSIEGQYESAWVALNDCWG